MNAYAKIAIGAGITLAAIYAYRYYRGRGGASLASLVAEAIPTGEETMRPSTGNVAKDAYFGAQDAMSKALWIAEQNANGWR